MPAVIIALCWLGCFPGGGQERTIKGNFRLEKWEDGRTYYLNKKGDDPHPGGVIEGTVERIGWNEHYIVAFKQSIFRGDPDGWMIIDLQTEKISGPYTDMEFATRVEGKNIETFAPKDAWNRL